MGVSSVKRPTSYVVRIVGMENGTWQGSIEHVQSGERGTFKGCLDMISWMEDSLGRATETDEAKDTRDSSKLA